MGPDAKPAAPFVGIVRHRRRAEFPPRTASCAFRAAGVLVPAILPLPGNLGPFTANSGGSHGFDALQVERLRVLLERVQFVDFRALEAVAFAGLQAVQARASSWGGFAGFHAVVGE